MNIISEFFGQGLLAALCIVSGVASGSAGVVGPRIRVSVPSVLPRGIMVGSYSPSICLEYKGLPSGSYRLKGWLLDASSGNFFCASSRWCERSLKIENLGGTNSAGVMVFTELLDVFDYERFVWVFRLYDKSDNEITWTEEHAKATGERPPSLLPIGPQACVAGEALRFELKAHTPKPQKLKFFGRNLPSGAELNPATGEFRWVASAGTFPNVVFEVVSEETGLTDAEVIQIRVTSPK